MNHENILNLIIPNIPKGYKILKIKNNQVTYIKEVLKWVLTN